MLPPFSSEGICVSNLPEGLQNFYRPVSEFQAEAGGNETKTAEK
jgi:hypothetical protein